MTSTVVLLAVPLLTHWLTAGAEDHQSVIEKSRLQKHLTSSSEQSKAQAWDLKPEEWRRYQQLMEGPLGAYSPGIDPLTALGIEARDSEELRRYTELQAHAEYKRVTKLFAYQNAYDEAFARLYPNLLTVDLLGALNTPQSSPTTAPSRLAVFAPIDCKGCIERIQHLQNAGHSFDVYVIDTRGSDERIRNWASKAGIDAKRVRNRAITLNHDAGRWSSVGDKGGFPAVMQQVNGQWQRQ
jgi:integrating conjugative element protein (TIGR03759 family)